VFDNLQAGVSVDEITEVFDVNRLRGSVVEWDLHQPSVGALARLSLAKSNGFYFLRLCPQTSCPRNQLCASEWLD
jgi:hypothetical protein